MASCSVRLYPGSGEVACKEGAARAYKAAYELPQDIDVASSEARLENGVLTLKLAKQVAVSRVAELVIN